MEFFTELYEKIKKNVTFLKKVLCTEKYDLSPK